MFLEENFILNEKVEFHFFPKFVDNPDLKKYSSVIKEAEIEMAKYDEQKSSGANLGRIILKILRIYEDIYSIGTTFACITVIGIIPHLLSRFISYLLEKGEETAAKKDIHNTIIALEKCKKKAKTKQEKDRFDSMIKKLEDADSRLEGF